MEADLSALVGLVSTLLLAMLVVATASISVFLRGEQFERPFLLLAAAFSILLAGKLLESIGFKTKVIGSITDFSFLVICLFAVIILRSAWRNFIPRDAVECLRAI